MVEARGDQAEGLRRMFALTGALTVAVLGGTRGAGATTCVVNLGAVLARQGRRVLAVDENLERNVSHSLGLEARFDLKDAMDGVCDLRDALSCAPAGIAVLQAAAAGRALPRLDACAQARAIACFAELDGAADIVLLDTRNGAREPSPFAAAAQEVIVVVSPGASSITGGYAAMKRMTCTHGRKRFRLLVNRAVDELDARRVQANMAHVARKFLGVALEYMGAIPLDPAVSAATRGFMAAVDAAPTAPASRRFAEHGGGMLRWSAPQNDVGRLDNFMQRALHGSRPAAVGAGV